MCGPKSRQTQPQFNTNDAHMKCEVCKPLLVTRPVDPQDKNPRQRTAKRAGGRKLSCIVLSVSDVGNAPHDLAGGRVCGAVAILLLLWLWLWLWLRLWLWLCCSAALLAPAPAAPAAAAAAAAMFYHCELLAKDSCARVLGIRGAHGVCMRAWRATCVARVHGMRGTLLLRLQSFLSLESL